MWARTRYRCYRVLPPGRMAAQKPMLLIYIRTMIGVTRVTDVTSEVCMSGVHSDTAGEIYESELYRPIDSPENGR